MSGLGRAVGAVLTGVGTGLAAQGQMDWDREQTDRLERLRLQMLDIQHDNSMERIQTTADLNDRNAGRDDARDAVRDQGRMQAASAAAQAERNEENRRRLEDRGWQEADREDEQLHDLQQIVVGAEQGRISSRLDAALRNDGNSEDIQTTYTNSDGYLTIVYENSDVEVTDIPGSRPSDNSFGTPDTESRARPRLSRRTDRRSGASESAGNRSPVEVATEAATAAMPRVSSDAEYDALPIGTMFVDPDGNVRRKQ
ncbi:MAG: hypothetical protein AAFW97_14455 [Pseudomonadota bacterium]